ncbi:MAG: alpha/beta hydrolase [Gammaproteobacteria bacterium]|nr:alpha/beta hydrolase [Gammaproteobacteria bacterium]
MNIIKRNNVNVIGSGKKTLMLAHGFGCDQNMWRFLTPLVSEDYKLVLFDYVGCGKSDLSYYDKTLYSNLEGYAQDVIDICQELELSNVTFVGHSVSSIIGTYASIKASQYFSDLVMVCPSPCFLNFPPDYIGGFEREDLQELLSLMDKNYIGWANYLAPLVMGQDNSPSLIKELEDSFCSTDPTYAKPFANATFFADDRGILPEINIPTLILQSLDDNLASVEIGKYMHEHIKTSKLEIVDAHGHCLHMTNPQQIADIIKKFLT